MDAALRPLTTSQVLDRTFQLYKKNFLLFVGIAVVGPGLTLLASLILLVFMGTPVMPDPKSFDPAFLRTFFVRIAVNAVIGIIVLAIGNAIATGATIHAVSMVHLGKTTTIRESYQKIKSIFWRILWVIVRIFFIAWAPFVGAYVLLIVAAIGLPLLLRSAGAASAAMIGLVMSAFLGLIGIFGAFIWAVFAYCRYALAVPACTVEGLPAKYAMIRSKFLSHGSFWRIFCIFALTVLLGIGLTSILQMPAFFFANPFAMKAGPMSTGYLFFAQLGEFLGKTLAGPVATIAIALVYYDERVRKEAFDLQLMMESLSPDRSQAAASASSS
ncbi:MAG TPA: hypothetical protein VIX19_15360 [Terriglobales bacterium]